MSTEIRFSLSEQPEVNETHLDEECIECQARKKENDLPRAKIEELLNRALLIATGGNEDSLDELREQMNLRVESIIKDQQTKNTSK